MSENLVEAATPSSPRLENPNIDQNDSNIPQALNRLRQGQLHRKLSFMVKDEVDEGKPPKTNSINTPATPVREDIKTRYRNIEISERDTRSEMETLLKEKASLEKQLQRQSKSMEEKTLVCARLEAEAVAHARSDASLKAELKNLEATNADLQGRLSKRDADVATLRTELNAARAAHAESVGNSRSSTDVQGAQILGQMTQHKQLINSLKSEQATFQQQKEDLEARIESLQTEKVTAKKELRSLKSELEVANMKIETLERDIEQRQQQLDQERRRGNFDASRSIFEAQMEVASETEAQLRADLQRAEEELYSQVQKYENELSAAKAEAISAHRMESTALVEKASSEEHQHMLQAEVKRLQALIDAMKKQLSEADQRQDELEYKLTAAESSYNMLKLECSSMKEALVSCQDECDQYKNELNEKMQELNKLSNQLESKTNGSEQRINSLQEKIDKLNTALQESERTVVALKEKILLCEEESNKLNGELAHVRKLENESKEQLQSSANQQEKRLQGEIERLQNLFEEEQKKGLLLEEQTRGLSTDNQNLGNQIHQLKLELERSRSKEQSLQVECQQYEEKIEKLRLQIEGSRREGEEQKEQISSLQESNEKLSHEAKNAKNKLLELNGRIHELEDIITNTKVEYNALQKKEEENRIKFEDTIRRLQEESESLKNQLIRLGETNERERNSSIESISMMKSKLEHLNMENSQLEDEIRKIRKELQEARQGLNSSQQELQIKLDKADENVRRLERIRKDLEDQLSSSQDAERQLKVDLQQQMSVMKERDHQIDVLMTQLASLEKDFRSQSQRIDDDQSQQVYSLQLEVNRLQGLLDADNREAERMTAELEEQMRRLVEEKTTALIEVNASFQQLEMLQLKIKSAENENLLNKEMFEQQKSQWDVIRKDLNAQISGYMESENRLRGEGRRLEMLAGDLRAQLEGLQTSNQEKTLQYDQLKKKLDTGTQGWETKLSALIESENKLKNELRRVEIELLELTTKNTQLEKHLVTERHTNEAKLNKIRSESSRFIDNVQNENSGLQTEFNTLRQHLGELKRQKIELEAVFESSKVQRDANENTLRSELESARRKMKEIQDDKSVDYAIQLELSRLTFTIDSLDMQVSKMTDNVTNKSLVKDKESVDSDIIRDLSQCRERLATINSRLSFLDPQGSKDSNVSSKLKEIEESLRSQLAHELNSKDMVIQSTREELKKVIQESRELEGTIRILKQTVSSQETLIRELRDDAIKNEAEYSPEKKLLSELYSHFEVRSPSDLRLQIGKTIAQLSTVSRNNSEERQQRSLFELEKDRLVTENRQLEKQVISLSQELSESQRELGANRTLLEVKREELKEEIKRRNKLLEAVKGKAEENRSEQDKIESQLRWNLESKVHQLESELELVTASENETRKRYEKLIQEKSNLDLYIEKIETQCSQFQREISHVNEQKNQLVTDMTRLNDQLFETETRNRVLNQQLEQMESNRTDLQNTLLDADHERSVAMESWLAEKRLLEATLNQVQSDLAELHASEESSRKLLLKAQDEKHHLDLRHWDMEDELSRCQSQVKHLETNQTITSDELRRIQSELIGLIDYLESTARDLTRRVNLWETTLETSSPETLSLRHDLAALETELMHSKHRIGFTSLVNGQREGVSGDDQGPRSDQGSETSGLRSALAAVKRELSDVLTRRESIESNVERLRSDMTGRPVTERIASDDRLNELRMHRKTSTGSDVNRIGRDTNTNFITILESVELNRRLLQLQQALDISQNELRSLTKENKELSSRLAERDRAINQNTQNLISIELLSSESALRSHLEVVQTQLSSATSTLNREIERRKDVEIQLQKADIERRRLMEELRQKGHSEEALKVEIAMVKEEIQRLKQRFGDISKGKHNTEDKIHSLISENKDYTMKLRFITDQNDSLQIRLKSLQNEKDTLLTKLRGCKEDMEKMQEIIHEKTSQCRKLIDENNLLSRAMEELRSRGVRGRGNNNNQGQGGMNGDANAKSLQKSSTDPRIHLRSIKILTCFMDVEIEGRRLSNPTKPFCYQSSKSDSLSIDNYWQPPSTILPRQTDIHDISGLIEKMEKDRNYDLKIRS
eukprot:gene2361-4579_t